MVIALRVKASATAVPTAAVEVDCAIAAAETVALRCSSGSQTTSAPASSAARAASPTSARVSPHGPNVILIGRPVPQSRVSGLSATGKMPSICSAPRL